jgi:type II secretory pathway pseudopilin PulG
MRSTSRNRAAFTLLEVILATMIIALLTMTLYRFLTAHLTAIRVTTEWADDRDAMQAVLRMVRAELNSLPPLGDDMLQGQAYKFHNLPNDAMTWRSIAGAGVLSANAAGEYRVTLTVQPVAERSTETELGLRRQPIDQSKAHDIDLSRGSGDQKYNWVPLIRPMAAIEVRYFDTAKNVWVDNWKDTGRYPNLIRIRLWKTEGAAPLEGVFMVPAAATQQAAQGLQMTGSGTLTLPGAPGTVPQGTNAPANGTPQTQPGGNMVPGSGIQVQPHR